VNGVTALGIAMLVIWGGIFAFLCALERRVARLEEESE